MNNPPDPTDFRALYMQLQGRLAREADQTAQQERESQAAAQAAAQAAMVNQSGSTGSGAVTPFVRQAGLGYGANAPAFNDTSATGTYGQPSSVPAPAMGVGFMQQINSLPRQPQYTAHGARMAVPAQFVGTGRGRGRGRGGSGANGGQVPVYLNFGGKGNMKRAYWCTARHILRESLHLFHPDHKVAVQQAEWLANNGFSQVINLLKGLTADETATVVSGMFTVMFGTTDFVLARYGPAGTDYSPLEAKHVKSLSEGSDGFAAFFTGVKWPTLFPANFDNEAFSTEPLDGELHFIDQFNAATRRTISQLYPGTEDEPDLYLPYPSGYVGPGHPDYVEPDVCCHLCGMPVSSLAYDAHVSECALFDDDSNDVLDPEPLPSSSRAFPKFASGSGALDPAAQDKGKKTPRQIERAHFGSILKVLVSENDKAYEAFRKVHEAFVADAKGGSVQNPGTSATRSEATGTGATAPESVTATSAPAAASAGGLVENAADGQVETASEPALETAADRAKRHKRNDGKAAPCYTSTSRGGKSKKINSFTS